MPVIFDPEAAAQLRAAAPIPRPPSPPAAVVAANVTIGGYGLMVTMSGSLGAAADVAAGKPPTSVGLGVAGWLFEHFLVGASIQIVLGVLTILCALGLWRRHRWARRGGQIVMATWAVLSVALGIAMAATVTGPPAVPGALTGFFAMWRTSALVASITWAGALFAPVWLLNRRDARDWFDRRPAPDPAASA